MLAIICLISQALGGSVSLNSNLELTWTADSTSITFKANLNASDYSSDSYLGIGIQKEGSSGMGGADIAVFYLGESNKCQDRYAVSSSRPLLDDIKSITCSPRVKSGNTYTYSWSRKLSTGETQDYDLKDADNVRILWAIGKVENGELKYHNTKRGYSAVSLGLDASNWITIGIAIAWSLI